MMSQENLNSIVEQLNQARRLEQMLIDNGLADQTVGQAARDAAYAVVDDLYVQSPEAITSLISRQEEAESAIGKLNTLKEQMLEMQLSTDEIDARITSYAETTLEDDERMAVAYFVGRDVVKLADAQIVEPVTGHSPELEDDAEKDRKQRAINIKFEEDPEDGALVVIGSRKVKLSGANEHQTDYSPERFAALAVMTELLPGEEIKISDLWKKIHSDVLGLDIEPDFNRHAMTHIRNFLTGLSYRNQAVFYHNGIRGFGSAYGVNPELNYDLTMDGTDEEIEAFGKHLMTQATLAASVIPVTAVQAEEDTSTVIAVEPAAPTSKSTELEQIPVPDTIPNILELHTFLAKIQSTLPHVAQQIEIDESSMLTRLYEVTEETLDHIEEGQSDEERQVMHKEALDHIRNEVTEKFIRITEDDDLLNDLLGDEYDVILENVYGKAVAEKVIQLIETILDMDDDEKGLLRGIISANGNFKITMSEGSFTQGAQVMDVDIIYSQFGNEPDVARQTVTIDDPLEDAEVDAAEHGLNFATDNEQDNTSPIFPLLVVEAEDPTSIVPVEVEVQEPVQEPEAAKKLSPEKLVRQVVGETINLMTAAGLDKESRLTSRQMEAVFGVSIPNIVNAKENNLISESNGAKDLAFKDAAMVIVSSSSDPAIKKLMSIPRMRKAIRKQLNSAISSL